MTTTSTHTEHEDDSWTVNIGDHPERTNSPLYARSRKHMVAAVKLAQPWIAGPPPYQDHHGGSCWVLPSGVNPVPLMYLLPAGIEWSAQFAADPAKVDPLRQAARALICAFTGTRTWYAGGLGMTAADLAILDTPITDAAGVATWTDSFWNASVPLPQSMHTGMPPKSLPGYHHAPKPIVDIRLFCRDDFTLFPTPGVAVVPMSPRGSGDGRVRVAWVDTSVHVQHLTETGAPLIVLEVGEILPAYHHVAHAAYHHQETK